MRPLDGLRIVDFTRHMSGPYGTVILSDYGADVIKVEALPGGDTSRSTGARVNGKVSGTFLMWNRGKRSIALDMRRPEAVDVVGRLVTGADVFVENYRPGVADQIGIGYEAMARRNPGLIYVSVSAFGRGPMEPYPGTDPVVQAVSGVMSVTGEVDGPPLLVGVPIADFTGAMMLTQAVMLGVLAREKTGEGQHIDVPMMFGLMSSLTTRLATYWATGNEPRRNGGAHSVVYPYQVFETADGYAVAGIWNGGDVRWPKLCEVLGLPVLAEDDRFATNQGRLANKAELAPLLEGAFQTRTTAEWERIFKERRLLFGAVYTFSELLDHPHVREAGVVGTVDHAELGPVPQLGPVIQLAKTPGEMRLAPPLLGQHTREILAEVGYDDDAIAGLLDSGLAVQASAAGAAAS